MLPLGKIFLIFVPKKIKAIIGKAVPSAYPITDPIPPHVDAEAGPIIIGQACEFDYSGT